MSKERACAKSIRAIVGKIPRHTFVAQVQEVSGASCKVVRLDNNMVIEGVRLNELSDENAGIVVKPKADSYVLVAKVDDFNYYVSLYSEIDSIDLQCDKITVNGGDNGGLINIEELTNKLNKLVDWCENHTHSGVITAVSGGSGAPAVGTPGSTAKPTSSPTNFNKSDYEDDKIKH